MKRHVMTTLVPLCVIGLVSISGCKVSSGVDPAAEAIHVDKVVSGYVVDQSGAPLAGVVVRSDDGLLEARTDSLGQFVLLMEFYDGRKSLYLEFRKDGYLGNHTEIPIYETASHYSTRVGLSMGESQALDSSAGGVVEFAEGKLLLTFGPHAFADALGNRVEGEVDVRAALIEPESLVPERLPVASMNAADPLVPDVSLLLASFGMFTMETWQGDVQVWPANGTVFDAEITGIERFVKAEKIQADSAIPSWTMDETSSQWLFNGWWQVVETALEPGARGEGRAAAPSDDDDPIGSDNTRYSIATSIENGRSDSANEPPPETRAYNCDAVAILNCMTGKISAEGLYQNTTTGEDAGETLSEEGVVGAWIGITGEGYAENCSQCTCNEQKTTTVCEDVKTCETTTNSDGSTTTECTTTRECHEETYTDTTLETPFVPTSATNACEGNEASNKSCSCTRYSRLLVNYSGSAYTDEQGKYCSNFGAGSSRNITVMKDWLITEQTKDGNGDGTVGTYVVAYRHDALDKRSADAGHMCNMGSCSLSWNHTIPCEWFWQNNACAVVGGCEVFHLLGYDEPTPHP